MNRLVFALNDLGIRQVIVSENEIRQIGRTESGVAWKNRNKIVFGEDAEAMRAAAPREICDEFWQRLDTTAVETRNFHCNHAELAADQLQQLYTKDSNITDAICIIPVHYQETQRRILAAIANDIGLPLRYMIPFPLARLSSKLKCLPPTDGAPTEAELNLDNLKSSADMNKKGSSKPTEWAQIHVDLTRNGLSVSILTGDSAISIAESIYRRDTGFASFLRRWLNGMASEFVSVCRIDPFHSAASEQQLRNSIPTILDTLTNEPESKVTVTTGDNEHGRQIQVDLAMMTGWSIPLFSNILSEIRGLLQRHNSCSGIHLSSEASRLPGLQTLLERELELPIFASGKDDIYAGISSDWPPVSADDRCLFLPQRPIIE